MKKLFTPIAFMLLLRVTQAQPITDFLLKNYGEKGFIENKGQIKDFTGQENKEVKYIYSHGIFNLELKQNGFSYEIFQTVSDQGKMSESGSVNNDDAKPS